MVTLQTFEQEVESHASERFAIEELDGKVVAWLSLTLDTFSARLRKLGGIKNPTSKLLDEIATFHEMHRSRQVAMLTRQLELERRLASLVEDAYGLTPDERSLLRSTRPVRDPLDVLEAKIRGGQREEVHAGD